MFVAGQGSTRIDVRSLWFLLLYAADLLEMLTGEGREHLLRGSATTTCWTPWRTCLPRGSSAGSGKCLRADTAAGSSR